MALFFIKSPVKFATYFTKRKEVRSSLDGFQKKHHFCRWIRLCPWLLTFIIPHSISDVHIMCVPHKILMFESLYIVHIILTSSIWCCPLPVATCCSTVNTWLTSETSGTWTGGWKKHGYPDNRALSRGNNVNFCQLQIDVSLLKVLCLVHILQKRWSKGQLWSRNYHPLLPI